MPNATPARPRTEDQPTCSCQRADEAEMASLILTDPDADAWDVLWALERTRR